MPLDFLSMLRPEMGRETRELVSPADPAHRITVTLARLDAAEELAAVGAAQALEAEYLGDPEEGVPPKRAFPAIGGRRPPLSKPLLYSVARVGAMMREAEGSEVYGFEQLVAMTVVAPGLWNLLGGFAKEISRDPKADNGACTSTSSPPV